MGWFSSDSWFPFKAIRKRVSQKQHTHIQYHLLHKDLEVCASKQGTLCSQLKIKLGSPKTAPNGAV